MLDGAQDAVRVGPGSAFIPRFQVRQVGQDLGPDVVCLQVGGQGRGGHALPSASRATLLSRATPSSGQTGRGPSTFRLASTRSCSGYIVPVCSGVRGTANDYRRRPTVETDQTPSVPAVTGRLECRRPAGWRFFVHGRRRVQLHHPVGSWPRRSETLFQQWRRRSKNVRLRRRRSPAGSAAVVTAATSRHLAGARSRGGGRCAAARDAAHVAAVDLLLDDRVDVDLRDQRGLGGHGGHHVARGRILCQHAGTTEDPDT